MTNRRAIEILENQKSFLNDSYLQNDLLYLAQTKMYFESFFGKDSEYYQLIDSFRFGDNKKSDEANDRLRQIFDYAIVTIRNLGIKKREWKHIFITTNPALFWSIFTAIVLFAFWMGTELPANKSNKTVSQPTVSKQDSSVHK